MGYQVHFQEAWFDLIPVLKGTNGDVLFQQRSSFRRGKARQAVAALRPQETIGGGGTHRE